LRDLCDGSLIYPDEPAVGIFVIEHEEGSELNKKGLEAIMSAIPSGVVVIEKPEGRITYVNDRALLLYGVDPLGLEIEKHSTDIGLFKLDGSSYPPEELPASRALLSGEVIHNEELIIQRPSGSRIVVSASAAPLFDENDQVVAAVGIFDDITDRKEMEKQQAALSQLESELRQRLEDEIIRRTQFTRALVHELKTPLTPVLASSDLLVDELHEESLLSLARNINTAAYTLNRRIDEMLDLAKGEMGMLQPKLRPVDLGRPLKWACEEMASFAETKSQTLTLDVLPYLPSIQADEERLQQVILNLLSNACKFTPEGVRINVRAKADDARLVVEVEDNGLGIPIERQRHLFHPYHRLERDGGGSGGLGLGLALCRVLVGLHGGETWVKSTEGEGATFCFSVPLEGSSRQGENVSEMEA